MEKAGSFDDKLKTAQMVLWSREWGYGFESLMEWKSKFGFKLVMDIDDFWELYPRHFLYESYKQKKTVENTIKHLRHADIVTVTTPRLAEKVRQINPNVHILPNALPYGEDQFKPIKSEKDDVFRFIYACQRSHLYDLRGIQGPLRRIAGERNNKIGFTLAGYSHDARDISMTWPKMESIVSAEGKMVNYRRQEQLPLETYMSVYQHADAVLVPLEANSFNACKSNLKLLEAAVYSLPVICQRVPPYSDCSDAPVLWVEKQGDWYKHIKYLSSNRSAAKEIGQALNEWAVKNYNLFSWNKTRFELYNHIVNS